MAMDNGLQRFDLECRSKEARLWRARVRKQLDLIDGDQVRARKNGGVELAQQPDRFFAVILTPQDDLLISATVKFKEAADGPTSAAMKRKPVKAVALLNATLAPSGSIPTHQFEMVHEIADRCGFDKVEGAQGAYHIEFGKGAKDLRKLRDRVVGEIVNAFMKEDQDAADDEADKIAGESRIPSGKKGRGDTL